MRWVSDDRVMRAADGLMDARGRVRDAWKVLTWVAEQATGSAAISYMFLHGKEILHILNYIPFMTR